MLPAPGDSVGGEHDACEMTPEFLEQDMLPAPAYTIDGENDAFEESNREREMTRRRRALGRQKELASTRWPGSEFKLEDVLPGSVYLWACGEPAGGDEVPPVSSVECAAAWVVLMTQMVCYAGLWHISGNRPATESEPVAIDDPGDDPDYSILAITGAMYLLLSIAAADLWGGCALCLEGRGSHGDWFWYRKAFGVMLLGTFVTLIGASIRVLFYSSFENVELVIGAAAVLFIADVDEKAMAVLQNVSGKWRLFWVVEVIGLSFFLAVLAIRLTGNATLVASPHHASHTGFEWCDLGKCGIYSWSFVISSHLIATTVAALLAMIVCTVPAQAPRTKGWIRHHFERSVFGRLVANVGWLGFLLVLVWGVEGLSAAFLLSVWLFYASGPCALSVAILVSWRHAPELKDQLATGMQGYRDSVDGRPRKYLFRGGLLSILLSFLVYSTYVYSDGELNFMIDADEIVRAFLNSAVDAWLVWGLFVNIYSADTPGTRVNCVRWILLGWAVEYIFQFIMHSAGINFWAVLVLDLLRLAWMLTVGSLLWGEEARTYGVGFWTAATILRSKVAICLAGWIVAWEDGTVK